MGSNDEPLRTGFPEDWRPPVAQYDIAGGVVCSACANLTYATSITQDEAERLFADTGLHCDHCGRVIVAPPVVSNEDEEDES